MIKLTIDGIKVEVEEGKTVLEAAQKAGIFIPTFCFHPKLETIGACRICLVEIEGGRRPEASCAIMASPDMVVHTDTPQIREARRINLEALLADHPLDCPHCESGGDCDLQKVTYFYGGEDNRLAEIFGPKMPDSYKIKYYSPIIERDTKKCIHCKRCVRTCHEIQGVSAIGLVNRGHHTQISPYYEESLDCEFCGRCVTLCPVGALINKTAKHKARPWEVKKVKSVCSYCGNGCRFDYWVKNNELVKVFPEEDEGMNQGNLCVRGYFGYSLFDSKNRLLKPRIMDGKKQRNAGWPEAISKAALLIKDVVSKGAGDKIALISSGRMSNEEHYLFQKYLRIFAGTNNFYTLGRLLNFDKIRKFEEILGSASSTVQYSELEQAGLIMVINSDVTENNPTIGNIIKKVYSSGKSEIINFNDNPTNISKFSKTNYALNCGQSAKLFRTAAAELYRKNKDNLQAQIINNLHLGLLLDNLENEAINKSDPDKNTVKELLEKVSKTENVIIVTAIQEITPELAESIALFLFCGMLNRKKGSGLAALRSRNNEEGAEEMGFRPDYLPGQQKISNFKSAKIFENKWKTSISPEEGLSIPVFMKELEEGRIPLVIFLGGEIPYGHQPISEFKKIFFKKKIDDYHEEVINFWDKLTQAGNLIVLDTFSSPLVDQADVALAISTPAEKEGTYINGERRIQKAKKAVKPLNNLDNDWAICMMLAEHFNYYPDYKNVDSIDKEISELITAWEEKSEGTGS